MLAEKTRKCYITQIIQTLERHKEITVKEIIIEIKKLGNKKYPLTKDRISKFLQQLKAENIVEYERPIWRLRKC